MASRPLIKGFLLLLNVVGGDPYRQSKLSAVRLIIVITVLFATIMEVLLECIYNWGGADSIEALATFVALCLLLTKIATLIICQVSLRNLLTKIEDFWPIDKCGEKGKQKAESVFTSASKSVLFIFPLVIVTALIHLILPGVGKIRSLPFKSYHPTDLYQSPDFELLYFIQSFCICIAINVILGFDGLFISIVINIICELKIIKEDFKRVQLNGNYNKNGENESLQEVYRIIDHHNLVLDSINDIRRIYSTLLLLVYLLNMCCICVGLLGIVASGFPPPISYLLLYGSFTMFFMTQLFIYCIAGNYLIIETESVSYAIYNTKWWIATQPEYRRACIMIIQRCNKKEALTAGGMFSLNLDSFRKVVKLSLSLFTLLEAMYNNNN